MRDTPDITGVGLRIRFYMIVYRENRLFYSCTVKGCNRCLAVALLTRMQTCEPPPWQTKCKNWAIIHLAYILVFSILLFFSRLFFFVFFISFFGLHSCDFGF